MSDCERLKKLKVALVPDFLTTDGGAERVLRILHDIWPSSTVFTPVYLPNAFNPKLENWDIKTSFISKFPFQEKLVHHYKLFYQLAMEQFRFDGFDLIISSTYAGYAKGIITPVESFHLSYVHNVPRFLWGLETALHGTLNPIYENVILPPLEHWWRIWDQQVAWRPDRLVANSKNTGSRIAKFYRRDFDVLYPPVETDRFLNKRCEKENYFVYFGRLEKYKRIDMAITACINTGNKLKIVGSGNALESLRLLVEKLKGENYIEFLGRLPDNELEEVVAKAKGFIFPCPDEDFGIVPVEAMAAGTPVIAFDSGGVRETIIDGKTGILVKEINQESLDETIKNFKNMEFSIDDCKARAKDFSVVAFEKNLLDLLVKLV